jgi:hypothetical protein
VSEVRSALLDLLRVELVGPSEESEVLDSSPCQQYSAGVLFPHAQQVNPLDDLSEDDEQDTDDGLGEVPFEAGEGIEEPRDRDDRGKETGPELDDTVLLANTFLPSAMGLTFLVDRDARSLVLVPRAAVYRSRSSESGFGREWVRHALELVDQILTLDETGASTFLERDLHEGRLALRLVGRQRRDGSHLVTVTLFNKSERGGTGPPRADACFFQVGYTVTVEGAGAFLALPGAPRPNTDPEELSLDMLYRRRQTFARGHGCAAAWGAVRGGKAARVETSTIPSVTLPSIQPRSDLGDQTKMQFLAGDGLAEPARQIPAALEQLAEDYRGWIDRLGTETVPDRYRETARDHIRRCQEVLTRIEEGIELLRSEPSCLEAFMLANRAILMQQHHYRRCRRDPGETLEPLPDSYASFRSQETVIGYWRNFQLAFILMNLIAFTGDANERHRKLVDLIWFPTGGGKTEAYLGLAAYAVFLRRLRDPSSSGVTALMRYTLRLLTAQQFQRASSLICACDELRLSNVDRLGVEPISIGLWVGKSLTPNTRQQALQDLAKLEKGDPYQENTFQLLTCPWCGTALDQEPLGYRRLTVDGPRTVRFLCPERSCSFSTPARPLPVLVIDDDIYDHPPTLVISTVDKFAMLAWKPQTGSLFGLHGGDPPDLIIQDELHLISGPLGSMVGLYESFIDLLTTRAGRPAKIVASTATIRRAREQCRALYSREAVQFPPPGLDVADSWFAMEDGESSGRTYAGVLPTASPSPVTALVRTAASLLQGVKLVPLDEDGDESLRDPYWTLVQYFGSLRELGRASTLIEADIPEYIKVMARRRGLTGDEMRWIGYPVELTSRRTASEIPRILEQLEDSYPSTGRRPLDSLLATNMISVGVDIERLGLMLVVGQPKSTSE